MPDSFPLFATAPRGVEPVLEQELAQLGLAEVRPRKGGAAFVADLEGAYRACLWSRTASRILLVLATVPAESADALYEGVVQLPWEDHLGPGRTLAVDFVGSSRAFNHSRFGAQKVKDAVVDRLRARTGTRPSVDLSNPDLRINVHLSREGAQVAIDLAGDALHRRGYRDATVLAPLKENLAAALLLKSGWPAIAAGGGSLLDPMCGSGTFAIEAALMGGDRAPGLLRERWGFDGWSGHDAERWRAIVAEARDRAGAGLASLPLIVGSDSDPRAVRAARANTVGAGLGGHLRIDRRALAEQSPPDGTSGLLITNPPYGERLGDIETLAATYETLGDLLKERFHGWHAAVFTGNPDLGKRMGIRAQRRNKFFNGAIPCELLQFDVSPEHFVDREAADRRAGERVINDALGGGGEDFLNRIRKNLKTLGRWARREGIECYRLYDADIPEFAVAVDVYGSRVQVQEYAPPRTVDPARAAERLQQVMTLLPLALELPPEAIVLKVRQRQRGASQYEKLGDQREWFEVHEGPARLLVNLTDYLDTGLFPDHRTTRALLGGMAAGKRFLNLFCYTGAATVHAALGGATSSVSVDLSSTYLDWARRNFALNGLSESEHQLIRADCLEWVRQFRRQQFDLIFLDPPTFSTSSRMSETWDVQRDHVTMIRDVIALLAPGGTLVFSTNHRRFRLDREALSDLEIEDISRRTLPRDFARNPRIHQCFLVRAAASDPKG